MRGVNGELKHLEVSFAFWFEDETQDQVSLMLHLLIDVSECNSLPSFHCVGTQLSNLDITGVSLSMSLITELTLSFSL
jgi:hypothetical protein